MKRLLLIAILCMVGLLAGCDGLVNSEAEIERRNRNITDLNARQFVDDWEFVWLYDRPSYLTEWPLRSAD